MSTSRRLKRAPSQGEDMESIFAMSSMDPDLLTLFTNQMKREIRARLRSLTDHIESSLVSMEKKNKAKNAKIIRAAKSQLEKLLSTRSRLLDEARGELAMLTQDYLTGYAQELDEIRTVRMAMVQRQEALSELLASEEKNMVHKPELDRERNSVMHLSAAKADCEDQARIIASLG